MINIPIDIPFSILKSFPNHSLKYNIVGKKNGMYSKYTPVIKRGKLGNPLKIGVSIRKSPISIVYFPAMFDDTGGYPIDFAGDLQLVPSRKLEPPCPICPHLDLETFRSLLRAGGAEWFTSGCLVNLYA